MKYKMLRAVCRLNLSLPVRGAWIEIVNILALCANNVCRSPCGERGLKYVYPLIRLGRMLSLPVRGAWIEICRRRFP